MADREWEIDFRRILGALRRGGLCILALAAEGALAAFLGTLLMTAPQYRSSVLFHGTGGRTAEAYAVILHSQETLETVLAFAGIGREHEELEEMLRVEPMDPADFFEVTVTSPDPREAELLADAVAKVLPVRIADVLEGASVKPVDRIVGAVETEEPRQNRNALLGGGAGLLLGLAFACADGVLDRIIRSSADLETLCACPVLAEMSGENGWTEGGRLLRTKLEHLVGTQGQTRILGITSPGSGEGKESTAEHLALSLKKQGKRVILADCDLCGGDGSKAPGLADYLTGRAELAQMIRRRTVEDGEVVVIPSGQAGDAAGELLASVEMAGLLQKFRGGYDYVIVNLPAMAAAGEVLPLAVRLDGILLTVRQDVSDSRALRYALSQLEFVEARVLGLVYLHFPARRRKTGISLPLSIPRSRQNRKECP